MAGLETEINFFKVPTKLANAYGVNVGWFQDQQYKAGLSMSKVARWQEYGLREYIPRRPFMHQAMMKHEQKWTRQLKTMVSKAIKEKNKKNSIEKALKKFGEIAKSDIQDVMLNGSFVSNAPITIHGGWIRRKGKKAYYIEGKGFNRPLVNTGILVASIQARTDKELL